MTLGSDDGLVWLDAAIHREILRMRAQNELSLDEFRGLYISDEQVDRLVGERLEHSKADELRADWRPGKGLRRVQEEFGLSDQAMAAVFVALAPELDLKYQTLFAYLNNDVTRKWPTIDLLMRLAEVSPAEVGFESSLFSEGLLERTGSASSHWRSSGVAASAPVRDFLSLPDGEPPLREIGDDVLAGAIRTGRLATVVIETTFGAEPLESARRIAAQAGYPIVQLRSEPVEDFDRRLRETLLWARLRRALVYFAPEVFHFDSDAPAPQESGRRLRKVLDSPVVKIFGVQGRSPWHGAFEETDYESVRLEPLSSQAAEAIWRETLSQQGVSNEAEDLASVSRLFSLFPAQIERAVKHVARRTGHARLPILAEAARRQSSTGLEALATRVDLVHCWDHLILPAATLRRLKEFAGAIRHREKVFREWSFLRQSNGRASLTALFSGSSGTGKTMSAGVVARELGLELYRIDLSSVVSKYIGETEGNLERVFRAAEGSNAILFFDEADALFGKRSEVNDAHDRYANMEIAYLLQRMETYDGVMILATNLAQNIDEAFSRRIQFEIEYPLPDEESRERLWRLLLPEAAPRNPDIDYEFLAKQFAVAGGDIRNVVLDAAFLAANEGTSIGMSQIVRALVRQRKKQGKLPSASEFRQYFEFVRADDAVVRENRGDSK